MERGTRSRTIFKLSLSLLLSAILALLVYTSLILPSILFASQQLHAERVLRNNDIIKPIHREHASDTGGDLVKLLAESDGAIQARDERIRELEQQLSQVMTITKEYSPIIDRADDGVRPLRVTVAHHPRKDMLGSFTLPSIFLLAITYRWGWEMEILPYQGSFGQQWLKSKFAERKQPEHKKSSLHDASYRVDYNAVDLNEQAYSNLGFFPEQPFPAANMREWTEVKPLPGPGSPSLHEACRINPIVEANGYVRCRLILPFRQDTGPLLKHIMAHGTLEDFLNPSFRKLMRDRFMKLNAHRLKYFTSNSTDYNVAIHVRRGDVNKKDYPDRWTEQSVYASIARYICNTHPNANIHVFSSGKNDEGWTSLEELSNSCGSVSFHLNEYEFDAWAHFVAADALVTSRSTFSYVPALFAQGEIYAPEWGHAPMKHWHSFKNENGNLNKDNVLPH